MNLLNMTYFQMYVVSFHLPIRRAALQANLRRPEYDYSSRSALNRTGCFSYTMQTLKAWG